MSQFIRHVITGLGLVCLYQSSYAQQKPAYVPPRQYYSDKITTPIKIDGVADDIGWSNATWSDDFTDIEGDKQPTPALRTRMKMVWDTKNLYIFAELEEPHIWATLHQHDTIIFQDNDFEVFVDPDGDGEKYFEIEINAHNTIMDLFMSKAYRVGGDALMTWDTKGLKTAVKIDGTLNNPKDKDKKWTVEMAIPFTAFAFFNQGLTPKIGDNWRINFSRVEWDTDIVNGLYVKRKNPATGKPNPEHNWVWSPQGIINMHAPEKWGYLTFTERPAGVVRRTSALPPIEAAKEYLWDVYARQLQYRRKNGKYAASLNALGITDTTVKEQDITYTLQLEGITDQFTATLINQQSKERCSINQEGKISQNSSNE